MVRRIQFVMCLGVACFLAIGSFQLEASAQEAASAQKQARQLFEEGLALAESERWAEALSAFRRSKALTPRGSTSYNVANALYRLDRPVQGLAELDAYDEMPGVRNDAAALERGAALRDLLEAAVAEVRLAITPDQTEVFTDGRLSKETGAVRRLRLNPGTHSIRVALEGYETFRRDVEVERGTRQVFTVALRPLTPAASPQLALAAPEVGLASTQIDLGPSAAAEDDRQRFVKRPGFWVMIAVIAAAGIGTGVAVALLRKDDSPQCGTTGDCATTQGLTVTSF